VLAGPPFPTLLSAYENKGDDLLIMLTNTDAFQGYDLRFTGSIRGNNGISAILPGGYIPPQPLRLDAGETQTLTAIELLDFYPGISEGDILYSGGPSIDYLIQSQRIPDGNYTICLQALDYQSGQPLSLGSPSGCSNPILITTLEPPVILTPQDQEEVDRSFPPMINISWTPVVGAMVPITYDVTIAEVPAGVNPYDAINTQNLRIYKEEDLMAPVLIYDESYPPLLDGKRYAIQVQAFDETQSVAIRNEGKSEVVTFTYSINNDGNNRQEVELDIPNFDCLDDCLPLNIPNLPDLSFLNPGDTIRAGYFEIEIQNASKNGNTFSGSGKVLASGFIPFDLQADFVDIQLNSGGIMTNGVVKTVQKAAAQGLQWMDQFNPGNPGDESALDQLFDMVLDPGSSISTAMEAGIVAGGQAIGLPIAFGADEVKVHITEIEFTPEGAIGKVVSGYKMWGDYIDRYQNLVFKNGQVCITPGGLGVSGGDLKLDLLNTVDYHPSDAYSLHFTPGANNGCRISFDCDGIQEIQVNGYASFNREYILPENGQGTAYNSGNLALGFASSFTSWDEMIFSFNQGGGPDIQGQRFTSHFQIPSLKKFTFTIEDVVLDISDIANHDAVVFPSGYNADNTWRGLFFQRLQVQCPTFFEDGGQRARFAGNNMLFDENGVTGKFLGRDVIDGDDGRLGGWGFTLDKVDIEILRSELEEATFEGDLRLPIADNPLDYEGEIILRNAQNEYRMTVGLQNNLEVPVWHSTLALDERSQIMAEVVGDNVNLEAILHGRLSFDNEIGDWDAIDIQNLTFENLTLSNNAPYISGGTFDLNTNVDHEFMGFKVGLEELAIGMENVRAGQRALMDLGLDLEFEFGGDVNGFTGGTDLSMLSRQSADGFSWSPSGVELNSIHIQAEMSAVSIDGYIESFSNDPVYGNGFGGELDAEFIGGMELEASALFGAKNGYDYWYVDGNIEFRSPVQFAPPMGMMGFGGGAYYNMTSSKNQNAGAFGSGNSMSNYRPARGGFGFKARTAVGVLPDPNICNGNLELEVSFSPRGGLGDITLNGDATMMSEINLDGGGPSSAGILLRGDLTYNSESKVLDGSVGYRVRVPSGAPIITADKLTPPSIEFHFGGADDWYVYLGKPDDNGGFGPMLGFTMQLPMRICGDNLGPSFDANTYFTIGSRIPSMPPIPQRVREFAGGRNLQQRHQVGGVGFGIHASFDIPRAGFSVWGCGVSFTAGAGLGFDAHLGKYSGFQCNGNNSFGINNWYAKGQGYVYGYASFDGEIFGYDFNILEVGFGAYVLLEGPNPIFVEGRIGAMIRLPIVGRYRFNRGFHIGTHCNITEDELANRERLEEQAQELTLITGSGRSTDEDISYFNRNDFIEVDFFKNPNWTHRFKEGNQVLSYMIKYTGFVQEMDGNRVRKSIPIDSFHHFVLGNLSKLKIFHYHHQDASPLLEANKTYRLAITATLEAHEGYAGTFQVLRKPNGDAVRERRIIEFRTKSRSNIRINDVISCVPASGQKFLHYGDHRTGEIIFADQIREDLGPDVEIEVLFTDILSGEIISSDGYLSPSRDGGGKITYGLPFRHHEGRSFQMAIVARWPDGQWKRLYRHNFSVSKYYTLQMKLDALEVRTLESIGGSAYGPSYHVIFEGDEPFDPNHEMITLEYRKHGWGAGSDWHKDRRRIKFLADSLQVSGHWNIPAEITAPRTSFNQGGSPIFARIIPNVIVGGGVVGGSPTPNNNGPSPVLQFTWRPNSHNRALKAAIITRLGKRYNPLTSRVPNIGRITEVEPVRFKLNTQKRWINREFNRVSF